jgi:16S rRNA (cytosine1402-N4)-methyltransferase
MHVHQAHTTSGMGRHHVLRLSRGPKPNHRDRTAIAGGFDLVDGAGGRLTLVEARFSDLAEVCAAQGAETVDGVVMDVGVSSMQLDQAERGFSFRLGGPLDMRMDASCGVSAAQWLASAPVEEIAQVIKTFGEERFAFAIARAIVKQREEGKAVETTLELSNLIAKTVRTREPGQDPATRTFQAIRIYINQELADLERGLEAALDVLKIGGRLVVISFHSLEDRIVKQFMQSHSQITVPRELPIRAKDLPQGDLEIIARIKPSVSEIEENPRARSAVMRIAEKRGMAT